MKDFDSIIICGLPVMLVLGGVFWVMRSLLDPGPGPVDLDDLAEGGHQFKRHSYWSSVLLVVVFFIIGMIVLLLKPR